jgi:hypothetical protein
MEATDSAKVVIEGVSEEYTRYFARHVQKEHPETKGHVRVNREDENKIALRQWWKELGKK